MNATLRILHLEDAEDGASFVKKALADGGIESDIVVAKNLDEMLRAIERHEFDLILSDHFLPGFDGVEAFELARERLPLVPFIRVSGADSEVEVRAALDAGIAASVSKDRLWELESVVRVQHERSRLLRANQGMARLVAAVQELSLARSLEAIMAIVRRAARELTGADGATFVLREGEQCYYADENAISPLWKGQRFPLHFCISGWAMLNRQPAVIEDIYADPRVPADAYRPTFVKSLAMVPIRTEAPIGAIGNYWARQHMPSSAEVELLQALANTTSVAMENVRVYEELEKRVADRTAELVAANQELESFSYAVSHDLRAPLRSIRGFSDMLLECSADRLDETGRKYLERIQTAGGKMAVLIDDLLRLARLSRSPMKVDPVNLSDLARKILAQLSSSSPERAVEIRIEEGIMVEGDAGLLRIAFENLFSNAWKYTSRRPDAKIEFGLAPESSGAVVCFVRDNGAGFEMKYARRLFEPFQRLHGEHEFPGTGIGLAIVQRVLNRHGAHIRAEAEVNRGATFHLKFPPRPAAP